MLATGFLPTTIKEWARPFRNGPAYLSITARAGTEIYFLLFLITAWAPARRAIGTRKGEQET